MTFDQAAAAQALAEKRKRRARQSRQRIAARATQVADTLAYLYDQEEKEGQK